MENVLTDGRLTLTVGKPQYPKRIPSGIHAAILYSARQLNDVTLSPIFCIVPIVLNLQIRTKTKPEAD